MNSALKTGSPSLAASPRLLVPLVGILVLLGAYAVSRRSQAPEVVVPLNGRPAPLDSDRMAALERKIEALQLSAVMARNSTEDAPSVARTAATVTGPEEEPARTAEEERAIEKEDRRRELEARQQFLQAFSDRVDTEPFDPAWRLATERSISSVFTERLGAGVTIEAVKCAATLCRVSLSHPDEDTLPATTWSRFALDRGDLASMAMHFDRSRAGATTIYLQRERKGVERDEVEAN